MNVRNVDGLLNKERPIEHTVEVNIYFKGHRKRTEVVGDFRDAMASALQSRDRLEDRRSKDDEVPGGIWQTVETNTGKVRMGKAKGGREKRKSREETG